MKAWTDAISIKYSLFRVVAGVKVTGMNNTSQPVRRPFPQITLNNGISKKNGWSNLSKERCQQKSLDKILQVDQARIYVMSKHVVVWDVDLTGWQLRIKCREFTTLRNPDGKPPMFRQLDAGGRRCILVCPGLSWLFYHCNDQRGKETAQRKSLTHG